MDSTTTFEYKYNPSNLDWANINLFSWNIDYAFVMMAFIPLFLWILFYIFIPILRWIILVINEDRKKIANKKKIKELILMKEVQDELDKEMEDTLLSNWINSSNVD